MFLHSPNNYNHDYHKTVQINQVIYHLNIV